MTTPAGSTAPAVGVTSAAPAAPRRSRRGRASTDASPGPRESAVSRAAAMLVMGVFTLYFLTPIWWLLVSSSKSRGDLTSTAPLWFSDVQLGENLAAVWSYQGGALPQWLLNSLVYAGGGALLATLLAGMCGYALAKYRFPGREVLFNVVLGGVLVPATALALPLFLIFSRFDGTNTFWSVFLPSIVSPFGVYLTRIFAAASVPEELLEAARLDGSGEVRTFFTVSVRLMFPALVTVFLFQFVAIWNNFFLPLIMLRDSDLFPVTLGLYNWNSVVNQLPELRLYVLVGALVSIVPLICVFLLLQRFWRNGLGTGAIK
ncbi:sugar ABC transporter permease [Cellulomonas carbonis]|uniref:ABC transporter permease n=2 Tax=Cellulomonas carbonis TaxID=1386092 RepID=A0A0A0BYS8_9CELL|nr:carbohydrate ABC transporter permease [Cellulomonas carbonis]KGM12294.1 ABC transporter permease [Cellulomonas carbonis T26]GGC01475.1 sugar ABC transporter permease [Cellulomonas carbonis]